MRFSESEKVIGNFIYNLKTEKEMEALIDGYKLFDDDWYYKMKNFTVKHKGKEYSYMNDNKN